MTTTTIEDKVVLRRPPSPVLRLQSYRRWVVIFDVDGAPECITVGAETKHLAIEYAEGALWLQLGKPDLDGFAPCCTSCVELSA